MTGRALDWGPHPDPRTLGGALAVLVPEFLAHLADQGSRRRGAAGCAGLASTSASARLCKARRDENLAQATRCAHHTGPPPVEGATKVIAKLPGEPTMNRSDAASRTQRLVDGHRRLRAVAHDRSAIVRNHPSTSPLLQGRPMSAFDTERIGGGHLAHTNPTITKVAKHHGEAERTRKAAGGTVAEAGEGVATATAEAHVGTHVGTRGRGH